MHTYFCEFNRWLCLTNVNELANTQFVWFVENNIIFDNDRQNAFYVNVWFTFFRQRERAHRDVFS